MSREKVSCTCFTEKMTHLFTLFDDEATARNTRWNFKLNQSIGIIRPSKGLVNVSSKMEYAIQI